jgi:DNA-binding NtrC family response regulator
VRLLAATNRDLRQAVEAGIFRLDLLYRLQVVELHIPALRERPEDIPALARHFLDKFCAENRRQSLELGPDAMEAMVRYSWPGNVRELENTMERATVLAPRDASHIGGGLLPPHMRAAA